MASRTGSRIRSDNKAIYSVSRGELNKRLLSVAESLPNVKLYFDHR
jgi:hypothetical protein